MTCSCGDWVLVRSSVFGIYWQQQSRMSQLREVRCRTCGDILNEDGTVTRKKREVTQ